MPTFLDPFTYPEQRRQSELDRRVSSIESRPRIVLPAPLVPHPVNVAPSADWYQAADVAGFADRWEMTVPRWTHLAVWVQLAWRTGAGTTGEVRVSAYTGDIGATTNYSSAVTLAANSSGSTTFLWLHGASIWGEGGVVYVQGRRTAGANSVELQFPHVAQIDPEAATTTGV